MKWFYDRCQSVIDWSDHLDGPVQWIWNHWHWFRCHVIHLHAYRYHIVDRYNHRWLECILCQKKWE